MTRPHFQAGEAVEFVMQTVCLNSAPIRKAREQREFRDFEKVVWLIIDLPLSRI
jgi:hypothetical protein